MATFVPAPNLNGVIKSLPGVRVELMRRARRIAEGAKTAAKMARSWPGRYGAITAEPTAEGATAAAQGSLAHLDEWGSANNSPTAAMRRAAETEGRFREA